MSTRRFRRISNGGQPNTSGGDMSKKPLDERRRELLKGAAAAGLAGFAPSAFAQAQGRTIRIGYVSPQSGPLAPFGDADKFVLGGVTKVLKSGINISGKSHVVEIVVKDSQSSPNRAGEVARELIQKIGRASCRERV